MRNQDEVDLYRRVSVGTQVVVLDDAMRCAAYAPPSVCRGGWRRGKQFLPTGKARDRPTGFQLLEVWPRGDGRLGLPDWRTARVNVRVRTLMLTCHRAA